MARRVGLKDIAEAAEVSISTVSHVLNRTAPISTRVRARVIAEARRLGYLDALRERRLGSALGRLLLAVPGYGMVNDEANYFLSSILNGVTDYCGERGITLLPFSPPSDPLDGHEMLEAARRQRADAILLLHDDRPELLAPLIAARPDAPPLVLVNGEDAEMAVDTVTPQNRFAGRKATRWLTDLGHRNVLHITWKGRATIARRCDGFRDAMAEAGLGPENTHVLSLAAWDLGLAREVLNAKLIDMLHEHQITAIFCAADSIALHALRLLHKADISVPGEVSVLGFDNLSQGLVSTPSLSSVDVPLAAMGPTAIRLLEERAAEADQARSPLRRIELGCALVARESVAPPPGRERARRAL